MAELIHGHRTPGAARAELQTLVQESDENMTDFVARLMECADVGYEDGESKDEIMADVFIRGLRNENILLKLLFKLSILTTLTN